MPVDASIPLSLQPLNLQNSGVDLGAVIGKAMQLKQMQSQMQTDNALKALFAQPDAIDPKTGQPTANTLAMAMKINPQAGLKIADQASQMSEREAQTQHLTSEASKARAEQYRGELAESLAVYDTDLKSGDVAPDIAEKGLKSRIHDYIYQDASISKEQQDALWGKAEQMSVPQLRAFSMSAAARQKQEELGEERTPATMDGKPVLVDKLGGVYEPNTGEKLKVTAPIVKQEPGFNPDAASARADERPPQVLKDQDGTDYLAYFGRKGEKPSYTTLQGEPYTPKTASHISSGQPRSAAAMAVQKYLEENPNATAEDLVHFNAKLGEQAKAQRDFATGQQGKAVNSFNVGIAHLNTLDTLVDALGNGDVKTINRVSQGFKEEFGSTAPTNFDAAKAIVGDEIIKAIVGGGGALADRENAQNQLDRAKTPEQLKGVIKTYKDLMSGQLRGLQKQYQNTTGQDDFDDKLLPDTKRELGIHDGESKAKGNARAPTAAEKDQFAKIPASRKDEAKKYLQQHGVDVSGLD